eukprot:scaffold119349_cov31-Tisochrysis_lutea.AAC.1
MKVAAPPWVKLPGASAVDVPLAAVARKMYTPPCNLFIFAHRPRPRNLRLCGRREPRADVVQLVIQPFVARSFHHTLLPCASLPRARIASNASCRFYRCLQRKFRSGSQCCLDSLGFGRIGHKRRPAWYERFTPTFAQLAAASHHPFSSPERCRR